MYYTEPLDLLDRISALDQTILDRAIATETHLSLAEYEGKVIDAGFPLAVADIPQNICIHPTNRIFSSA